MPRFGPQSIQRRDGRPVADLTAELRPGADLQALKQDIDTAWRPELLGEHPTVDVVWAGGDEEQERTVSDLLIGVALAWLVMYGLLATFTASYIRPFVVLAAVPFGWVGAVVGHALLGLSLNIYSFFGLVALGGVIVNDSLVLLDVFLALRRRGTAVAVAVREAASSRFRPILLTTTTTFVGLLPLMAERDLEAQFLIPMAVSMAFGLLVASVLILFLVPSLILMLEKDEPDEPASPASTS